MAEAETDNSEPLKYKTWVLKVSIHCEGCKRKVKRILHSVEGVYTIDVDTKQHKVVVTGNVDENTLIRKLEKSGKHAELWPDFYQKNSKKNDEQFHQDQQPHQQQQQQHHQQQQQQPNQNQNQNQNPNIEKPKVAFRVEEPQNSGQQQQQQPPPQGKEVRFEGNIPATGESQNPPPNVCGNPGGGGAKKKKKKKKGHGGNNSNNNNNGNGEVASMENGGNGGQQSSESHPPPPLQNPPPQNPNMGPGPNPAPCPSPEYMSQPQYPSTNRVYEYPPAYYAPAPVYGVSYNTAYPSSSYSASYYTTPYSYAYVHHGGEVEAPGPLDWNPSAVQPSDSFEMFSDENPNACSVM